MRLNMVDGDEDRRENANARRAVKADHKAGRISTRQMHEELADIERDEMHPAAMDSAFSDDY